jgi:hypothetical protein
LLLLLVAPLSAAAPDDAAAGPPRQGDAPVVVRNEVTVDYPHTATFRLELAPGTAVSGGTLSYRLGRRSCLAAGTVVPAEVEGASLSWTWVMSRSGNPPPGVELVWEWTVSDAAGNTFAITPQTFTFRDERFEWRSVATAGNEITLQWYRGDEVGPVLLEAAEAGLERIEHDIGLDLAGPAQIYVYGSAEDMRGALLYVQDWAGGVAFDEYNIILLGVPPSLADSWGSETIRHELAHLVVGQFAWSCLGASRPTWLDEGLAVYAEGQPDEALQADIARGVEQDGFLPVRSLNGAFPAHDAEATMAYSQSYSLVNFLLQAYGQEEMRALLGALAGAAAYDAALEQVYDFNADGLEVVWRAAVGAPPRAIPPTPTPIRASAVPTSPPLAAIQTVPTPTGISPAAGEDGAAGSGGLCAAGGLPLLGAMLLVVSRRRPRHG